MSEDSVCLVYLKRSCRMTNTVIHIIFENILQIAEFFPADLPCDISRECNLHYFLKYSANCRIILGRSCLCYQQSGSSECNLHYFRKYSANCRILLGRSSLRCQQARSSECTGPLDKMDSHFWPNAV